jgi:hypothetical protein
MYPSTLRQDISIFRKPDTMVRDPHPYGVLYATSGSIDARRLCRFPAAHALQNVSRVTPAGPRRELPGDIMT